MRQRNLSIIFAALLVILMIASFAVLFLRWYVDDNPAFPTVTPTLIISATPSDTPAPTATVTPTSTPPLSAATVTAVPTPTGTAVPSPTPEPTETATPTPERITKATPTPCATVIVQHPINDTLWVSAWRWLGTGTRWGEIQADNGIGNPRHMQAGDIYGVWCK